MKNSKEKRNRSEKGITLIALVVSLVILIILALIGINIAFNDDGVFKGTQKSAEVQSNSTIQEREDTNSYVTEVKDDNELKLEVKQEVTNKPANGEEYAKGEIIEYKVTLTNTGEKNLVDLELKNNIIRPDKTQGTPSELSGINRLDKEESTTINYKHTVEDKDLGGELKSEITAIGYAEGNSKQKVEETDKISVATEGSNANLEITKEVISNPANPKGYMVGEEIIYKVTVKNKGKTTESNIIIEDEIKRLLQSGEEDPIDDWTFDTFYKVGNNEETNQLGPNESGYRTYSYTVQQKDLGKTLINNAKIRGKNKIPPGVKPVEPDKPSGTITITKSISTEGMLEEHKQEVLGHAYTFTLNVTKNGTPVTDTFYYTDENNTRKTIQSGGTFTLKDKQKITITGIPDGATYLITEDVYQVQNSGYYVESDKEEYTGTIDLGSSTEGLVAIECINKEVPGLKIEKEVVSTPKYKKDAYMVGETVQYQIKVTNIGRANIAVTEVILDDELSRLLESGQKDPIKNWTFDILYEDREATKPIAKTNTLQPGQVAYSPIYSYTIVPEDLGKTLINNVKIRKKPIPPGEKPVKPDEPTGTLTITKAYYEVKDITTGAKFKITLKDKNGQNLTNQYPYYRGNIESGKITNEGTFALDNGEAFNIIGLPDGTKFTIQEIEAPDGFNLNPEIKEGTINLSNSLAESVAFINYKGQSLPSTGGGSLIEIHDERKISLEVASISGGDMISEKDLAQLKEKLELRMYLIAEFSPEKPIYNVLEQYRETIQKTPLKEMNSGILNEQIDYSFWRETASFVNNYILENGIAPDFVLRDRDEILDYKDGLYLIAVDDIYTDETIYRGLPYLVMNWSKQESFNGYEWIGPGMKITSFGGGTMEKRQDGSLEIVNTIQSCNTNSAAPFVYEVNATKNGELVYSNIVSIDITEAGQQSINILGEIPVGTEVTVKCIYSGVYQLMTESEQTVLVDNPDEVPTINFTYKYDNACKIVTSTTHSFMNDEIEGLQWSKDKGESIGYGIGDDRGIAIALVDELREETIYNRIDVDADSNDVYVRVKAFAPTGIDLSYVSEGQWQEAEDGYCYYSNILTGSSTTESLGIKPENINENFENFNVVVVVEATKVQYDESGNPYANWNMQYNFDEGEGAQ